MQAERSSANQAILLASNGLKESAAAVAAAGDLSRIAGRPVHVIAGLEPPPLVAGPYGFVVPTHDVWEGRRAVMLERVRRQINDVIGHPVQWPIDVRIGNPATVIADVAATSGAALILMGLGRHRLIDRALGSETALHTLRSARTPILAVPDDYSGLPTSAVVGVDFSDASIAAARQAITLLPSLTRLILVQVAPSWDVHPAAYDEWRAEYERAVAPGLEWVVSELAAPERVAVTVEVREGRISKTLLTAAEDYAADVIIVGSKGLGILDRMVVGSTASGIIRNAQTAVFALPITALSKAVGERAVLEMDAVSA